MAKVKMLLNLGWTDAEQYKLPPAEKCCENAIVEVSEDQERVMVARSWAVSIEDKSRNRPIVVEKPRAEAEAK